jgi:poly-gamma-glutamate capsule biosynthesis protein CapA/YwtB (metallophosphatase superfamily)
MWPARLSSEKERIMVNDNEKSITMYAVGDIGPDRADPGSIFKHVTDVLSQSDIAFCQLEVNLSHRGVGPLGKENARDPKIAAAIREAGFNMVSFASNHSLDAGLDAFFDTIDNLKKEGLPVIGVGRNIEEARRPAVKECRGTKIAFLGYSSVAGAEHYADVDRPGCAPVRAWTLYEPIEPTQPGTPARAHTFPYRGDIDAMVQDIKKARSQADLVVVSMHSGVHMTPALIAEYQIDMAHAVVDAGADLILQHHAHILKGVEVYHGKAIFYGLGNFALEVHFMTKEWAEIPSIKEERRSLNPDWNPPYPDYPSFPFPPDSRKTMMAKCVIADKEISKVSFLPTIINKQGEPEILAPDDERFDEIVRYMEDITRDQGLNTSFTVAGDEVIIDR